MNKVGDKIQKKYNPVISVNLLLGFALVSGIFIGGLIKGLGNLAGLLAIYYIFRQRKDPSISKRTKYIRWTLIVVWLLEIGFIQQMG